MSFRTLLILLCFTCLLGLHTAFGNEKLTSWKDQSKIKNLEDFGAENSIVAKPIGGGVGYASAISEGTYTVEDLSSLLVALKFAKNREIIFINGAAKIDLSCQKLLVIPGGVTLVSDRGVNGSPGALLFTNNLDAAPMIIVNGENVRIIGIRLRGPDPEQRAEELSKLFKEGKYYSIPNSQGIKSSLKGLEVNNCELFGWSHAAIMLGPGAKAHIHHNYIHHNQRWGLGYGVCLDDAWALIEANLFDWNRHAIAGTGRPATGYEACYNIVLENANSYSFDMHGGVDRKDGTDIAGDLILIHHNTFRAANFRGIMINGRPLQRAEIHHNWFLQDSLEHAIYLSPNTISYQNAFGPSKHIVD